MEMSMTPVRSGKLPLSSAAMKVTARALSSGMSGHGALMAALRHEEPKPFSLSLRGKPDQRVQIDQPLVWISGAVGSGKTEATVSLMKDATRVGYRTVSTSTHNATLHRWRPEERVAIDLREVEDDPEAISCKLRLAKVAFCGKSAAHLGILLPNLHKSSVSMAEDLVPALVELSTLLDVETRIVLSDPGHLVTDLLSLVAPLREAAIRSGSQVLIETSRPFRVLGQSILDEDGLLLMYTPEAGPDQSSLRSEEGLLRVGETFMAIDTGYEAPDLVRAGRDFFAAPSHPQNVYEVAKRIDERVRSDPTATHIGRLELVAQACGYRSWHAAQGREHRV